MFKIYSPLIFILAFGCGPPSQKPKSGFETDTIETNIPEIKIPLLPEGAVTADFNGNFQPFYAYVKNVDVKTETTFIGFEGEKYPPLLIPESLGGSFKPVETGRF